MGTEENKAIVRRLMDEGWNANNPAAFDELLAENFVNHDPTAPRIHTRDELKAFHAARTSAFPDQQTTTEDLIAEGNQVVKRWTWRGTQTGNFNDIPATGRAVTLEGITIYRIENGKITELWWGYDQLGVLQQLGLIPEPEAASV